MKSSTQKPGDLNTLQEAVAYLRGYIVQRGSVPDETIASALLGLNANGHFDEWYKDSDFAAIIDAAGDLEWSNGSPASLTQEWTGIEQHLAQLEKRYQ